MSDHCSECGRTIAPEEAGDVSWDDGIPIFVCPDCCYEALEDSYRMEEQMEESGRPKAESREGAGSEQPAACDHQSETWAIVEIMGHRRYAGRVSQDTALGVPLLRVEVPETKDCPAFEKRFAAGAIYCVTPCTEAAARAAAEQWRERPAVLLDLPEPRHPRIAAGLAPDPDCDDEEDDVEIDY